MSTTRYDRYDALAAVALLLAAVPVFGQVAGFGFLTAWDDPAYVSENPQVLAGLTAEGVRWAFSSQFFGLWTPLTWLSHMLDVEIWGDWAGGHHLTSLALHLLSGWLLYRLLRLGGDWRPALLVALLWLIHPMRAESVAWVSERKDVLSALFYLATLYGFAHWRLTQNGRHLALALLAGLLAMLAKPMAVTLPATLLLLNFWPLCKGWERRLWLGLLPFALLSAGVIWVTLQPVGHTGMEAMERAAPLSWPDRLQLAASSYGIYLWKLFWPIEQAFFHPRIATQIAQQALLSAVVWGLLLGLALWQWRRRPVLLFGLIWYGITLAPASGIVPISDFSHADRYSYLPHIGLLVALIYLLPRDRWTHRAAPATGLLLLVASGALAHWQVGHWRNDGTLSARALEIYPEQPRAMLMQLEWLVAQQQYAEAIPLGEALLTKPLGRIGYSQAARLLGDSLAAEGRLPEARRRWQYALRANPRQWLAAAHWGRAELAAGNWRAAAVKLAQAIRLYPDDAEVWLDYGRAVRQLGHAEQAANSFRRALLLKPDLVAAKTELGRLDGHATSR